ncbi:MAG: HDOD domain-containing protein [Deltaproteobacteria bacterium]|nr:HDOD domain-containing protein [Deltaproteobacteria bacterium]
MNETGVLEDFLFTEGDRDDATIEASGSFAAKLAHVDGLKTFPVVAQQVLALLSSQDFSVAEVTGALGEDPSLAVGVLRMANSAFFAGTKTVDNLDQAFVRLGSWTVREAVAAVATMDLFPDSGGVGKQVRDHCAATAAIVQSLARKFAPKHANGIFLAGLMHDVGKMLLIESGEIDYAVENIDATKPNISHLEESSLLGYDHAILGGYVLSKWKIPSPIPKVVAWHHQPSRAYQDAAVAPLVAILRLADQLDAILRDPPENYEDKLKIIADSDDCARAWITAEDLVNHWEALLEIRVAALKMFGGR